MVEEEFLVILCVQRPQPDRQHEFRRLVGHLERTQVRVSQLGLFLEVHLRNEEAHLLLDVAGKNPRSSPGRLVAVFAQPGFQSIALFSREDLDVILADGVLRLDRNAQRLRSRIASSCNPTAAASVSTDCLKDIPKSNDPKP